MRKPDDNQVQIIEFGPGVGDSILIHIDDGYWVVVDSCKIKTNTPNGSSTLVAISNF